MSFFVKPHTSPRRLKKAFWVIKKQSSQINSSVDGSPFTRVKVALDLTNNDRDRAEVNCEI